MLPLQRTGGKAVLAQHLDLRVAQFLQFGGNSLKTEGQRLGIVGVGGDDSWGANVHPEYIPDVTKPVEFTFTFRGI